MQTFWIGLIMVVMCVIGWRFWPKDDVKSYQNQTPTLVFSSFFDGPLTVTGLLKNRFGHVQRRFTATIAARWNGNKGILDERFVFDDGEVQTRTWHVDQVDAHHIEATAGDVVGVAKGQNAGHALHLRYKLAVPLRGRQIVFEMSDWMFQIDAKTIINHTIMSKWGFKVGELMIVIQKQGPHHG